MKCGNKIKTKIIIAIFSYNQLIYSVLFVVDFVVFFMSRLNSDYWNIKLFSIVNMVCN